MIDYSICCFSLSNPLWREILLFLGNEKNKYTDEETFYFMYPKIAFNISTMFLINKDYSNSISHSKKAIEFCRKENNFIYLPYLYYNSACAHSMIKSYDKANKFLNYSKNIFKLQNNIEEYNRTFQSDYQIYFNNSDFAIEHKVRH